MHIETSIWLSPSSANNHTGLSFGGGGGGGGEKKGVEKIGVEKRGSTKYRIRKVRKFRIRGIEIETQSCGGRNRDTKDRYIKRERK